MAQPRLASYDPNGSELFRLAQHPFCRPIAHLDLSSIVWRTPLLASHHPSGSELDRLAQPPFVVSLSIWIGALSSGAARFGRLIIHMDLGSIG